MKQKNDIQSGDRFGKLTVIRRSPESAHIARYECKCDCGNIINTRRDRLINGKARSCGKCRDYGLERILSGKVSRSHTTGIRGVYYRERYQKYEASIRYKGNYRYLGWFDTLEEAVAARKAAEDELRTKFGSHSST